MENKMNIKRALELMKIEKECIQRNKDEKCDRECEVCDLLQNTDELLEAYEVVINFISNNIREETEFIKT